MEKVLEETLRRVSQQTCEEELYPDVELDENGRPVGCYTPEEVFDELDRKFVEFYGEEGRRMVNARRERWNRKGTRHFDLL